MSPASSRAGPASRSTRCSRASARSSSRWRRRSHGASSASARRSRRSRRRCAAPAPACRIRTGRSGRSCSSGPPASARPSSRRRLRPTSSTTRPRWCGSTCPSTWRSTPPPGYVGYEEGGALTEAVRRRPYQVVLFDEVEKAHPDVFNVLLQVLDDGRLTDGKGRTVDFRNTLLIMTSNLGSEYLVNQREGEDTDAVRDEVMGVVRSHFRPEFLNRVDEIILFHRLKRSEMGAIVDIQMARLSRLLDERKIVLTLEPEARAWLAEKGYDPGYGARPLKRVIQKNVQDPLAEAILAGEIKDGETVPVRLGPGGLAIGDVPVEKKPKRAPEGVALH